MYIRGFDLASDTQTGCYIRGFDLQHTSSGGFMHEVLISLLAWRIPKTRSKPRKWGDAGRGRGRHQM